jgi:hypothetical protein
MKRLTRTDLMFGNFSVLSSSALANHHNQAIQPTTGQMTNPKPHTPPPEHPHVRPAR